MNGDGQNKTKQKRSNRILEKSSISLKKRTEQKKISRTYSADRYLSHIILCLEMCPHGLQTHPFHILLFFCSVEPTKF